MKTERMALKLAAFLWAAVGSLHAATLEEFLFDQPPSGPTFLIHNEVPSGDHPSMQSVGNYYTNLQVAGGPFSNSVPYHSIGMLRLPSGGPFGAYGGSLDWTTKTNLTIEMWVDPSQYGNGNPGYVADAIDYNGQILRLYNNGGYYLQGYIYTTTGYYNTPFTSAKVFTNTWTHIAMTFDGSTIRTYVNGVLDGTLGSVTGTLANNGVVDIGSFNAGINTFQGGIDEIRISDVALLPGDGSGKGVLAWNATLVPEPSAMALIGVSAGWLLYRRRWRCR